MAVIIELKNIYKRYPGEKSYALSDITTKIEEGEQLAIIGPSGGGKSTLLNIMATLDISTSGDYLFNNKVIFRNENRVIQSFFSNVAREWCNARIRREMGFVFQTPFMLGNLSVLENLRIAYSINKGSAPPSDLAIEMLDKLGLRDFALQSTEKLSGGQRQRVAIGRALLPRPKVLFADEPTGSLDIKTSEEILELLCKMCEDAKASLVLITHQPEIAVRMQRCLGVRRGKIEKAWDRPSVQQLRSFLDIKDNRPLS